MQSKRQGSWAVRRLWCGVAWTLWTLPPLSLVPVAMCQHGRHRHYWQDHRCQQHCHCHHQCLFCVLGVIFKSIHNLGHYVPIVAKSCFDHILRCKLNISVLCRCNSHRVPLLHDFLDSGFEFAHYQVCCHPRVSSLKLTFKEKNPPWIKVCSL